MKRTLAALGLAALASTTFLSAASADPAPRPAIEAGQRDAGPGPRAGMQGPAMHGPGMHGPGRRGGQMRLAEMLSGAETLLGIRANQLDAWRDYTSALLALFEPPAPPPQPDENAGRAFAREQQMIRAITERAAKAAALEKAIAALQPVLTPDQLDKLGKLELDMRPPRPPMAGRHEGRGPGPRMGAGEHGPGPMDGDRRGPGMGHGPMNGGPGFDADQGPGAPPAPGADDDGPQPD